MRGGFGLLPVILPPHVRDTHAIPDVFEGIHCWADVEYSKFVFVVNHAAVVVVNNVTNVLAASVDDPVVSVEWVLVAETHQQIFSLKSNCAGSLVTPINAGFGPVGCILLLFHRNSSASDYCTRLHAAPPTSTPHAMPARCLRYEF